MYHQTMKEGKPARGLTLRRRNDQPGALPGRPIWASLLGAAWSPASHRRDDVPYVSARRASRR